MSLAILLLSIRGFDYSQAIKWVKPKIAKVKTTQFSTFNEVESKSLIHLFIPAATKPELIHSKGFESLPLQPQFANSGSCPCRVCPYDEYLILGLKGKTIVFTKCSCWLTYNAETDNRLHP